MSFLLCALCSSLNFQVLKKQKKTVVVSHQGETEISQEYHGLMSQCCCVPGKYLKDEKPDLL